SAIETLEKELANSKDTMTKVRRQYNDVVTWADMYNESPIDVKKMIIAQLINTVKISADYKIEIDFKISERQLGLDMEVQPTRKPRAKKKQSGVEL
ncbi:MAG: hypothetical protein FWC13_11900, partial [Oscillospiraceae bacterium]|nr:hypothetical protein [Oscillospiraceae bacterium]